MEIPVAVAAKITELTVVPIARHTGYLLCYSNNLNKLKIEVEELRTTKERIDLDVEAERRSGREIHDDVQNWQKRVVETLGEVHKLYEDQPHASVRCWICSFPNLKSRYQLSRKANKMAFTIAELKPNGRFDAGVGYVRPLDITNFFSAPRGSDKLETRNSVKEEIVLSLKDPKVSKIGVYGINGMGKTTLVKAVAKQVMENKMFDAVAMVAISQKNLEGIQDEIAEQLGLHTLKEMTTSIGRANHMCERIKKENTILILDDLWEEIDLEKLGIPSLDIWEKVNTENVGISQKDGFKVCKLLLTSTRKDILEKNDSLKNFSLTGLNDEESWRLFEVMIGDVVKDANFQTTANQVVQRCAGFPALIVTIAKSLKNQGIHRWKDTLNSLQRVDNRDMADTLFSSLKLNFKQLKDEAQKVFLLCGAHGTSILFRDLLKYVMGLGILECINTIEDARNRLLTIIDDLKAYCLLDDDDDASVERIKMHDSVREVAISIASENVFTKCNAKLHNWLGDAIPKTCTHIILKYCCIEKLPERLDCPHLTFLLINSGDNRTLEIPDSFFEGIGSLKALDLTGMILASLPISLKALTKLKTLCLDQCSLKDMAGIGALKNLEILSLIHSSMEEFPGEIEQLTKLRMLDLSYSGIGTTLPNILCKLTKIEELYMGNATIRWEAESSTKQERNATLAKLGHLTTLEIYIRKAWLLPREIPFDELKRYKVVIGDEWEWSSNNEASKLLKIKLDTSIHFERGIKTLIERVEDLYLDKIHGISNVLFELNGEGFPFLKHLYIQNNGEIHHIINSMNGNQTFVLFPELETLTLHCLHNLVKICHGPVMDNSFGKIKVVKIKSCDKLVYLFSVSIVKAFSQLVEIEVSECSSMKNIVSVESADSGKTIDENIEFLPLRSLTLQILPTIDNFCSLRTKQSSLRANIPTPFFDPKVKFSNLETLKLSSVNLEKLWDDNQSSAPYLVENLANLTVEDCGGLKYLFSSSMFGRLLNLKQLEISKCDMMEEIIATEEINGASQGEVIFPKLEVIIIKDMQNLKTMWHPILASNSLACFKALEIKNCEKIEKIFPEYMYGAFAALETLSVQDCDSVQEIFELDVNAYDTTKLKYIVLLRLPQLKQIWSRDPQSSLRFKSLQVVRVEDCDDLEYLFPFSIAENLPQLETITINNAEKMKEIVSKKEEPLDNPVQFVFNQLTSMVLWNLHNLQGFYAGNHSLSCSMMNELDVFNCKKLKVFKTQGTRITSSQGRLSDDGSNLQLLVHQPLFTLEEVKDNLENLGLSSEHLNIILHGHCSGEHFKKLKVLRLRGFEDDQTIFPYWFVQDMTGIEHLLVEWSSFKEIFPNEVHIHPEGKIENTARIKIMALHELQELHHICKEGCQTDPILEVLEYLYVDECSELKRLVPSSVTFNHLTYLNVENCNGLIYLITSSTARSLEKLTTLKIRKCDSIEEIVTGIGGDSINEITFNSLLVLELDSLSKLQMFCSGDYLLKLPLLVKLVIRQCPRMTCFSTGDTSAPMLQKIVTDEEDGKWCWDGDLTGTVNKMFHDMVAFSNFTYLELSEYPELKELWYGLVWQKIFCNLRHLVVRKCTFLSNILFSSNLLQLLNTLEKLEVAECDSLEVVFDVKALDDQAIMESKKVSGLKKLTLSKLPNLKHIWNREAEEIISFGNLQIVKVDKCQHLKYLFSISQCQDLRQLEGLHIESCGVQEIVSFKEGPEKLEFDFPLLTNLQLLNLTQLTNFCPKRYTLECPSLRDLNVRGCEELQIFAFDDLNPQPLANIDLQMKQALFNIEKVSQNLEELPLNENDTKRILNGNYDKNLFQNIKRLRLQQFQETPIKFLNALTQIFPATTTIQARCSSFKKLFSSEEIGHCSVECPNQIKILWLYQLEQLELIWSDDDTASHPLVQTLENLFLSECSRLIRLAPRSASFKNLTSLNVEDCNGLMYFMTPYTAKSLINLIALAVSNCKMLEEVVMMDDGESDEVITFESLKYLELTGLSGLKGFCSGKHTFIFSSLVTLKVIECHKMQSFSYGDITAPFLKLVEVENGKKCWKEDLNSTITQLFIDKAIGEEVEGDYKESSSSINIQNSQIHQMIASTSRALTSEEHGEKSKAGEIVDPRKQEMHKLPIPHEGTDTQKISEISETPLDEANQNTSSLKEVDAAPGTEEMNEGVESALTNTTVQETGTGFHVTHESIDKPFVQATQNGWGISKVQKKAVGTGEMYQSKRRFSVHDDQNILSHITAYDSGKSNDPGIIVEENSPIQATNSTIDETIYSIDLAPSQGSKATSSSTTPVAGGFLAIGTQEIHETMDKPLIQTDQDAEKIIVAKNIGESRDSYVETQKICHSTENPSMLSSQNVPNSTMALEDAIDPSPSQAPKPMISSNNYGNYKGMIDIHEHNMPYLEAGLNRHPQVLDWLNTKRRRVFASSFFSLFAEVTRILRTTRKVDLMEDDRNYIRECCAALQGVRFDESWINYVHGCIEEFGDEEEFKRKIEEAEGHASNLKAQLESIKKELASVEESLVLLRDNANRLHDFIES